MTKQAALLDFCYRMFEPFSSVQVRTWGMHNFYSRADRTVRAFAADPSVPIRRIPPNEVKLRGLVKKGNAPLAFYENT